MPGLYESKWATPSASHESPQAVSDDKTNTTSMLSGAAPTFSPLPAANQHDVAAYEQYSHDDNTYTESMQTRPQDDLFDDDFIPATEPAILEPPTPVVVEQPIHAPRGKGRGRGRAHGHTGRQDAEKPRGGSTALVSDTSQSQAPENAPTGPRKETTLAVRGDRQATGGIRKPKLSEAELAEKMAQITIKNASLAAAHARAEADAESFANREAQAKVAASKRAQSERKDRQQMMGEREKNRMRKLKAMEGREWDAEKNEDDFSKGGRFDGKGFAGDKTDYSDGREYLLHESSTKPRPTKGSKSVSPSAPPKQDDFPALPLGGPSKQPDLSSIEASGKSWADQVESSAAGT